MAHSLIRGKQTGMSGDMSAGLNPELFVLDNVARYGINSQTTALAYDPVQSLLAVGTKETKFGGGQLYVFGQKRVSIVLGLSRQCSVQKLQFCADKLICLDSKNDITVFSLETMRTHASYAPPGKVTTFITDPLLDYIFIGLQNGDIVAYDMENKCPAPFKIPNLWREVNPRARITVVETMSLHPRDIGTLLIGYTEGAAIYSFKQNKATQFFIYELQPGAPGGLVDPASVNKMRRPRLIHATWHPTGTFILTTHEDDSIVIWDPKTAKIIQARSLKKTNVNIPGSAVKTSADAMAETAPLFKIVWCAKQNPDDTGILIAGGGPVNVADRGLTFWDLGPTPVYQTSSWQVLSDHFERPKKTQLLKTPPFTDVLDFCLIPRTSPHFAGCSDPIAVISILNSGELATSSFPSGFPIPATNQLHPSLSFIAPFVNQIFVSTVDRTQWLGLTEKRDSGPIFLRGGAPGKKYSKRFESRNVIQTAHADGSIRLWDPGHGDEIENEEMLQIDLGRALVTEGPIDVTQIASGHATGETIVGTRTGEVLVFRMGGNKNFGRELPPRTEENMGLINISERTDPSLNKGMLPLTMFAKIQAPVTAVQISDVGFCAAGFENGSLVIMDLRGPAVIFESSLLNFEQPSRRGSIRRSNSHQQPRQSEWPTKIEFGVLSLDGEDYSSILLFVGTNRGRLVTIKILPQKNGTYTAEPAGSTNVEDAVVAVCPVNTENGRMASASQQAVGALRQGGRVNGLVMVVTRTGAKLFKPPAGKGASKDWKDVFCDAAGVVRSADGVALVGLFGDGSIRTYSIPGLKELTGCDVRKVFDPRRHSEAVVTPSGDVFGWCGPSEIAIVNPWGSGMDTSRSDDHLFNPQAVVPPRPTISNMQWLSGTQHITPIDMDVLVGGADRPPSKKMMQQMGQYQAESAAAGGSRAAGGGQAKQDEGYMAYLSRQMQERTEKLNIMGDSMDRLAESSQTWADDVNKYVKDQKKKAVMGMIGSKFGM